MDNRIVERTVGFNAINENASLTIKNATVAPTPRKLPFSDQTNKAEGVLRSALKLKSFKSENSQSSIDKQSTSQAVKEEAFDKDDFEGFCFDTFTFPPNKNCYCCGDDQKTDEEIWGERLALTDDFLNLIDSVPLRFEEKSFEPPSPVKIPPPFDLSAEPEEWTELSEPSVIDESLDNSNYQSALEDDLDSSLEIPECKFDDSILQDW